MGSNDADFPLFGRNLTRTIIPLVLDKSMGRVERKPGTLHYIFVHRPATESIALFHALPMLHCTMRWSETVNDQEGPWPYRLYSCTNANKAAL